MSPAAVSPVAHLPRKFACTGDQYDQRLRCEIDKALVIRSSVHTDALYHNKICRQCPLFFAKTSSRTNELLNDIEGVPSFPRGQCIEQRGSPPWLSNIL